MKNLHQNKVEYDTIHFAVGSKLSVIQALKPDAIIEDKPSSILEFVEAGFKVFSPNNWNYVKNAFQAAEKEKYAELLHLYDSWHEIKEKLFI